jgi:glycosyltransferase involved in cell wall biosynthesis
LYQLATLTLYPSTFEGFGIPIIESLWSKTPVITNSGSCFKETAGEGAIYLNQVNKDTLSNAMIQLLEDSHLQNELANAGFEHVQQFERKQCIQALWNVYQKIL